MESLDIALKGSKGCFYLQYVEGVHSQMVFGKKEYKW